jgi:hypothetical protein
MKRLLAILLLTTMPCLLFAPPVGQTSEWGIVITPCAWCGATNNIEVHHIWPQHLRQDLKYSKTNLICLCRRCHFTIGHKNNWTNVFKNVMTVIEAGKK